MLLRILFHISLLLIIPGILIAAPPHKEADVIHWWVSGGENAALQSLIDSYEKQGYHWKDTKVESSYRAKAIALTRVINGNPPTAMQWHAGVSLKELYKENIFSNITEIAEKEKWKKVLPEPVWNSVSVNGEMIAAPLTLHGSNWLWANKEILQELNEKVPTRWADFLISAEKIKKAGYIPLALGGQPWQERALFTTIVLGTGGPEFYENVFVHHDIKAITSPLMEKAFTVFGELRKYVDVNSPGRNWTDTTKLVIEGKAAFQIMGDWVKGEFLQAGMTPGEDFICAPSPGSKGSYIFVVDVFAMGNTENDQQKIAQRVLAKTIMDPEVQKQFNLIKGSIPPRTDIATDGFDLCAKMAMNVISQQGSTHPGFNITNTGIMASSFMNAITAFWDDPNMTPKQGVEALAQSIMEVKRQI